MSTNLGADQVVANQNQAEVSINNATGRLDAALTENLTTLVDNTNAVTISDENLRANSFHTISPDAPAPTGAITVTVAAIKRGLFMVFNDTAETVTVEITSQPLSSPAIDAGDVALLDSDGTNVRGLVGTTGISGTFVNVSGDTMTGQLFIDGGADEIQLLVQGHSTQTSDLFIVEDSAGADIFQIGLNSITCLKDLILDDGVGGSPNLTFSPATGTSWSFAVEDAGDDLQIGCNTASLENIDVVNSGAGEVDFRLSGKFHGLGSDPELSFDHQPPDATAGNVLGILRWRFSGSTVCQILGTTHDGSGGDFALSFQLDDGVALASVLRLTEDHDVVVNPDNRSDVDFIVNGDTLANLLFVDASADTVEVNGPFGLPDGITAPGTLSGTAWLYVDTADGDLKVKFGDGTVKTIATNP